MTPISSFRPFAHSALLAALLAGVSVSAVSAQTPPQRPELVLFDANGNAIPAGTPSPTLAAPTTAPGAPASTGLVQRDFAGQGPAAGTTAPPAAAPAAPGVNTEVFQFIEEGAPGPNELAQGLSERNSATMVQTGAQLQGNYGNVDRAGLPAGQIQEAWARPFENMSQGQSAPGNVRYQWSNDLVMPIRLREGMHTSIVIPDWDEARDVIIGDSSTLEARVVRSNLVAVRPISVGRDTSITIVGGSGNVYTFYARTEGRNTQVITDAQVFVQAAPSRGSVDWFTDQRITSDAPTGGDGLAPIPASHRVGENGIIRSGSASQGEELVPVDRRIFDMKMYEVNKGDRIIAPDYVYSDGKFTYFHFPAGMTDRPVIRRIVDGVEGQVNSRVGGRHSEIVIVEAVGDFILRSGTRAVCVLQVDQRGAMVRR